MLKCQQFEDSQSDKTEPRGAKRQSLDERDNKKRNSLDKDAEENGLDKDKSGIKNAKYISLPFIPLLLFS